MSEVRAWLAALTIHVGQMLGGWIFGASAVIWGLLERAFPSLNSDSIFGPPMLLTIAVFMFVTARIRRGETSTLVEFYSRRR